MAISNVSWAQPGDTFIDFAQPLTHAIAAAAAAAGVDGIMQYVPYTAADRPKYGSAAEAQIAHEHGLYYLLNWEIEADRPLQGYSVGRSDGARSRQALREMGYPEQVSAPVSVDINSLFGNKDAVSGFVRGHWETDGDQAMNMAYLDTDGGRLLGNLGLDAHIWIPGALSWSPDLYSFWRGLDPGLPLRVRRQLLAQHAALNPQAAAIQFPSEPAFGIRVDFNTVLHPFPVWCAPYETDTPDRPPVVTPIPEPHQEVADMPALIRPVVTATEPDIGNRNEFLLDAGYAIGVGSESFMSPLPVVPVSPSVWDEIVANSDRKKQADAATASLAIGGSGGGESAPRQFSGHISSVPGDVTLNAT